MFNRSCLAGEIFLLGVHEKHLDLTSEISQITISTLRLSVERGVNDYILQGSGSPVPISVEIPV